MSSNVPPPSSSRDRRHAAWRWIFICSHAALVAVLGAWVERAHRGPGLNFDSRPTFGTFYHPVAGTFVEYVYMVTMFFLLLASPFFFRRFRWVAWSALATAVAAFAWSAQPVF